MNCYEHQVNSNDLVVANMTEFNLTEGKVYRVVESGLVFDCISIVNDLGEVDEYTKEYFDFYEGQPVKGYFIG